jgi:cytoskeletal protein CcmA (bactofilin family)
MAFGRSKEEGLASSTVPSGGGSGGHGGGLTAFIDQGSEFEGKLHFKDTVRIDGCFTGEIKSENTLIVGETGEIQASIQSKCVLISGTVVGDVIASQKVVLHKTARVQGNVEAPCFAIEDGAVFNGQVKMQRPEAALRSAPSAGNGSK